MSDTRSRQALEPVGASTTPWVYNLDLKLDKDFTFGGYQLKVFARVNNFLIVETQLMYIKQLDQLQMTDFTAMMYTPSLLLTCTVMIQMEMV